MIGQLEANLPPHSVEAEQAMFCGIFQKQELLLEVIGLLEVMHFYRTPHQLIWTAMQELHKHQAPVHMVSVAVWLEEQGKLSEAGGYVYLMDLVLNTVDCFTAEPECMRHWAHKIREWAGKRMLRDALSDVLETDAALPEIQDKIHTVADLMSRKETSDTGKALEQAYTRLENRLTGNGGSSGLSTGLLRLDALINGLEPNKLITVAARSGYGKTAFSLNIAETMILKHKRPVLFFSLEMTAEELLERMIRLVADNPNDRLKLDYARQTIREHQDLFLIEDNADRSISEILAVAHKSVARRSDLGLVVVDYLGKIKPEQDAKRYQSRAYEIEAATWGLKTLAKTKSLPVMVLCQMNRLIEGRGDKNKPQLSDLKDSGAIEQDSDIVIFLTADDDNRTSPTLTVAKNRNGQIGEIPLIFRGATCRFTETRHGAY